MNNNNDSIHINKVDGSDQLKTDIMNFLKIRRKSVEQFLNEHEVGTIELLSKFVSELSDQYDVTDVFKIEATKILNNRSLSNEEQTMETIETPTIQTITNNKRSGGSNKQASSKDKQ